MQKTAYEWRISDWSSDVCSSDLAAGLLARNPEAKLLAGGHSLLPVMKQRLAQPSALIDLSLVEGLSGVEQKGRSIVIGAMTRHVDAANSPVLDRTGVV